MHLQPVLILFIRAALADVSALPELSGMCLKCGFREPFNTGVILEPLRARGLTDFAIMEEVMGDYYRDLGCWYRPCNPEQRTAGTWMWDVTPKLDGVCPNNVCVNTNVVEAGPDATVINNVRADNGCPANQPSQTCDPECGTYTIPRDASGNQSGDPKCVCNPARGGSGPTCASGCDKSIGPPPPPPSVSQLPQDNDDDTPTPAPSSSPGSSGGTQSKMKMIIIVVAIVALILVGILLICALSRAKKKKTNPDTNEKILEALQSDEGDDGDD